MPSPGCGPVWIVTYCVASQKFKLTHHAIAGRLAAWVAAS